MLKVERNNKNKWRLLLQVLSNEIPESNPEFQYWLQENIENIKLYESLRKGIPVESSKLDKERMFESIADSLSFKQKGIRCLKKRWFSYAAAIILLLTSSVAIHFFSLVTSTNSSEANQQDIVAAFSPGSKKAFLLSSKGEPIDLSESFQIKSRNGTLIYNDSAGIVCVKKEDKKDIRTVENCLIYVPKGGEYTLILADGSKVYLNSESTLSFPSYFIEDERKVELTGEAYFEVEKNAKPFIVYTNEMQVHVLGTSFNINAYQGNSYTNTTLVEGSVLINLPNQSNPILLKPSESINLNKSTRELSVRKVDTSIYTAWVKGEFVFRRHPLGEILKQLSRWYDFNVEYEDPTIKNLTFTGSMEKNNQLDYLLNMIKSVTNIKYRKENETIILYR